MLVLFIDKFKRKHLTMTFQSIPCLFVLYPLPGFALVLFSPSFLTGISAARHNCHAGQLTYQHPVWPDQLGTSQVRPKGILCQYNPHFSFRNFLLHTLCQLPSPFVHIQSFPIDGTIIIKSFSGILALLAIIIPFLLCWRALAQVARDSHICTRRFYNLQANFPLNTLLVQLI